MVGEYRARRNRRAGIPVRAADRVLKFPVEFDAADGDFAEAGRPGGLGHLVAPGFPGGAEILDDFRVLGTEIVALAEVGFEIEELGELITEFDEFPLALADGAALARRARKALRAAWRCW